MKYKFSVESNFHIENFMSHNNQTNDSFFWLEQCDDHGGRTFHFGSSLLDELESAEQIFRVGNQILSIYSGIYALLDRNRNTHQYFSLRDLFYVENDKSISRNIQTEIFKIDVDFSQIAKSEEKKATNSIYVLFEKIIQEEFLINLFFLLSNKVDYRMLYMIYDDLRYYLRANGDRNFLDSYDTLLNRFSHTANNYEVLGFYARHGRTNHQPPASPMSLEESKNLIFDIIVKLLNDKFGIQLPKYWGLTYLDFTNLDHSNLDWSQYFDD